MQTVCQNQWCKQQFEVTDDDLAFYEKVSPEFSGKKYTIPPPTLCPDCRSRRRMAWRNERFLSLRPCGLCHKTKVSMFAPDAPYHAYCSDCFYGDRWDPLSYGRDYDFSKSFHTNIEGLLSDVPLMMLYQAGVNENCDFTNYFGPESRNCYLMYNSGRDEDCCYSRGLIESKSCIDMLIGNGNQFCYECVNASDCYHTSFSQNVAQCVESAFLFNCRHCTHCFGCTNLVQKEYYLFNKPCTPAEFESEMSQLSSASFVADMRTKLSDLRLRCIHRENNNVNIEHCTGDYLINSKNCIDCYESKGSEDCKRILCSKLVKDSHDLFGFGYDSQLLYDCVGTGLSTSVAFTWICTSTSNLYYSLHCDNIHNCFGCISVRLKQYCILNKQYTKEEYEALVGKIITAMSAAGEWGEWLPWHMSPFAYNETVAQEFLPLKKQEATVMGFRWNETALPPPVANKTIRGSSLPDTIEEIPDDVLEWAIVCENTAKPFKLTKQELDFYRARHLPVPRLHPDERHKRRMALRNPCKLWKRECMKCRKPIETSYSPDRPEIVYCERCYLETVY
ncbi:hypothetical protein EXS65_00880 [Candidatus Peribacteria bacterium]|nr:hypothetical protein [Candidatus Peribacteria bacterium]